VQIHLPYWPEIWWRRGSAATRLLAGCGRLPGFGKSVAVQSVRLRIEVASIKCGDRISSLVVGCTSSSQKEGIYYGRLWERLARERQLAFTR